MTFTELDKAVREALPPHSSCCCQATTWYHGFSGESELRFRITAFAPNVNDRCEQTGEWPTAEGAFADFRANILPTILRQAGIEVTANCDLATVDV
jgi:hypothetical protein